MFIVNRLVLLWALLPLSIGCSEDPGQGKFSSRLRQELQKGMRETLQVVQLSSAYAEAQDAAMGDSRVIDRLGKPIEQESPPVRQGTGELNLDGEPFQIAIKGPKGSATVRAIAMPYSRDPKSIFVAKNVTVAFSDGSTLDLAVQEEKEMQP
jgi:hypothetical protein